MPGQGSFNMRSSAAVDLPRLEPLYERAFPDEDLFPLVRALLHDPDIAISLVSETDAQIVGHIIFTKCAIEAEQVEASLLGPLAVSPEWQGKGIGSDLVRYGLQRVASENVHVVCALGDPAFYGRFGFEPERSIRPPYALPPEWTEAWQSVRTADAGQDNPGTLAVPTPWRKAELWGP